MSVENEDTARKTRCAGCACVSAVLRPAARSNTTSSCEVIPAICPAAASTSSPASPTMAR